MLGGIQMNEALSPALQNFDESFKYEMQLMSLCWYMLGSFVDSQPQGWLR